MDFNKLLENYALLTVTTGINLQKGQPLVISSPVECYEFVRIITRLAYEKGARNVYVEWIDEEINHLKLLLAPEEAIKEYPLWQAEGLVQFAKEGAAFLLISSSDPELFKDVNPKRMATSNKATASARKELRRYWMNSLVSWCMVSVPTKGWAKKVFSSLSESDAVSALWEKIFSSVRADKDDVVKEWKAHIENLNSKVDFLNSKRFKFLHYKSSITDLHIELPKDHIWCGACEYTGKNICFVPNLPTEEVFTLPLKTGVNGKVTSSKPLNYSGNLINNFTLTFENGKIVDFSAETGKDALSNLINVDEGSHYLGEVALVPHNSPISNSNIVFYNTLYDENASCHLAIGKAYPSCLKNGTEMNDTELEANGVNNSLTHNDFMIGTEDLNITGETFDGEIIQIFTNGNWNF